MMEKPFHCGFELTPFCNFRCNMCYIRLNPEEAMLQGQMLPTSKWISLAREAKEMGALSMEVTGGEAMTRSDFPELYSNFYDLGFLIVLRTNGYLIDDNKIKLIKERKPRKVIITLYGASDETYKRVCGINDGYSVVTTNILKLKEAGVNVQLTTTITTDNINDVEKMKQWANDNGYALSLCGMLFNPIGNAKRSIDHLRIRTSSEEFELSETMKSMKRDITNKEYYMNPFWMCRAFGAKMTVTWDGRLTACNSNRTIWRDPFSNGLEAAYHDLYRELKQLKRPKECETCSYLDFCTVCPSMLNSANGTLNTISDDMCKFARRKYKNHLLMNTSNNKMNEIVHEECYEGEMEYHENQR